MAEPGEPGHCQVMAWGAVPGRIQKRGRRRPAVFPCGRGCRPLRPRPSAGVDPIRRFIVNVAFLVVTTAWLAGAEPPPPAAKPVPVPPPAPAASSACCDDCGCGHRL